MEIDSISGEGTETSKKIEDLEKRGNEIIRVLPSSLGDIEKAEEMVCLFRKEVEELKRKPSKKIEEREEKKGLGTSGDEDTIIGGVRVAGGSSTKTKKKRNKKKRKSKAAEDEKKGIGNEERIEGIDLEGVKRNWTSEERRCYGDSKGVDVEVESDYGPWT